MALLALDLGVVISASHNPPEYNGLKLYTERGAPAPSDLTNRLEVEILRLENEGFDSTYGPASPATYLNSLVPQGALATNYYATGHASLDNYIAMTSGQPDQPVTGSDCATVNLYTCVQGQQAMSNGANVADQLEAAGLGWKQYADDAWFQHHEAVCERALEEFLGGGG